LGNLIARWNIAPRLIGMAPPCRTRGLRPRRGFAAAARLGEWLWKDPKSPKVFTPACSPSYRRVPSVHPFVPRHAPMGHPWPSGARSASSLAAWTNGLTSANNRGQHPTRSAEAG